MTPPSVLAELRAATQPQHERIERLLALDAPMPLNRYAAIIGGFHTFLHRWEQDVQSALPVRLRPWFGLRRRARFAADDLAWLQAAAPAPPPATAEEAWHPDITLPALFGSMYVVEGSALGGQVITPWLRRELGLAPGAGASYFHGFGERTGAMWREFRELAQAEIGAGTSERYTACAAAQATFGALLHRFEGLSS
ncbi:biliverdin-producing heme oxygenase [Pelomonas sp. KK5]|uniref:biliverdin-producing heme oxygenase n=1 Tax=Pelomonas sp. KK5 TaxID=1855730 RepID=UPI00097C5093|nr:biliverdin-producing heme oxygenase [Pelomonas sp. KK5]